MGLFISVEGGEFTGKSSLVIPVVARILEKAGYSVFTSREPGATPRGEEIRKQIFQRVQEGASPYALAQLFSQARRIHLEEVIWPALGRQKEQNPIVLLDRYIDSTIVYQGLEAGVPLSDLKKLEQETIEGYYPDATLLLYFSGQTFAPVFTARKKLAEKEDARSVTVWDEANVEKQKQRQDHYLRVPEIYREWGIPREYRFINASAQPREVVISALCALNPLLGSLEGSISDTSERLARLHLLFHECIREGMLEDVEDKFRRQEIMVREMILTKEGSGFMGHKESLS